jgi:PKD repeat protein
MRRLLFCALLLCPLFLSGCLFDTILGDVVNSAPRAVIDVTPSSGAAPLAVSFDAHYSHDSDGAIVEYLWDFGDPVDRGIKRGTECTYTYRHAGTYLATLSVVDDEGATDSQQIAVVVTNPPPVPQASVSSDSPSPGREVVFDASASYDPDGTIMSYQWEFGDDTTANGEVVRHTYLTGAYYVVTLTVIDNEGASASIRLGMNVLLGQDDCEADDSTCSGGDPEPYAVIEAHPNPFSCSGGRVNQPITFRGHASRAGVGKIVGYAWDFGDGTTAAGETAIHAYTRTGRFVIRLTVTDEAGGTSTALSPATIGVCY